MAVNFKGGGSGKNTDSRVDEFGELLEWEAENQPKIKRLEQLKKEFLREAADGPTKASEPVTVEGDNFTLEISPASEKRSVTDPKKIHDLLGDAFYSFVTVPLKAVDDYLTIDQRQEVTKTERTGPRKVKACGRRTPRHKDGEE